MEIKIIPDKELERYSWPFGGTASDDHSKIRVLVGVIRNIRPLEKLFEPEANE